MSLRLRHGTVKRSLEMKMVMRFTEVKEKIIKNKAINSTDKVKDRHRRVIRIGAFALIFVVLISSTGVIEEMALGRATKGGPMMGKAVISLDVPVTKGTNSIKLSELGNVLCTRKTSRPRIDSSKA